MSFVQRVLPLLMALLIAVEAAFMHWVYYHRNRPDIRRWIDDSKPLMSVKEDWIFLLVALIGDVFTAVVFVAWLRS